MGEPALQYEGVGLAGHSRVTHLRIKSVLCEGLKVYVESGVIPGALYLVHREAPPVLHNASFLRLHTLLVLDASFD